VGRYLLRGFFVAPDVKYSGMVETTVERTDAPTEDEATALLHPLAEQDVVRWRGENYQAWFTSVTIEEQQS
jgi:hypothetical protein